ncbi:MAG: CoA transferase [Steroidobacteraceae bacterium]|nr:CoA transferase [Steroidobacteraceae bacterium]
MQIEGARLARELAALRCPGGKLRVGGLARFGLAYDDLKTDNPALIYCSISAFGQDGPDADKPGYDAMIQGMGGLMSITGLPDGEPGGGPQKVGVAVVDLMTGMYAATAITAALYERRASGKGQYIDLALLDTQLGWLANQNMNYLVSGHSPRRQGTAHPNIVPYQAFATADGFLMLAVGNDRQFASWCSVAGRAELAADVRFATNAARVAHRAELVPLVAAALRARTTHEWLAALNAAKVPCGPINDIGEVFAEPQIVHRGMRIDLPHPTAGHVPGVRNPINYSRTAIESGEHHRSLASTPTRCSRPELGLDSVERAHGCEGGRGHPLIWYARAMSDTLRVERQPPPERPLPTKSVADLPAAPTRWSAWDTRSSRSTSAIRGSSAFVRPKPCASR